MNAKILGLGTDLEDDVKSDGSYKSAYPTLCRVRLVFDTLFRKVLIIDDDRFCHVAIS